MIGSVDRKEAGPPHNDPVFVVKGSNVHAADGYDRGQPPALKIEGNSTS